MKYMFVGGSGRSGTSAFVHRLQTWPTVGTFVDTELRLFSELDGVWDLYWNFVETYSPQRAAGALRRFIVLTQDITLTTDDFVGLGDQLDGRRLDAIFGRVKERLTTPDGVARRTGRDDFFDILREMTVSLAATLPYDDQVPETERVFIEKTPHCLLRYDLLREIGLDSLYIHVMRDPRLVAASLSRMPWGPGSLEACCDCVSAYIRQKTDVFVTARSDGVPIHSFFMESVARNGPAYAGYLSGVLGQKQDLTVFESIDPATLNVAADRLDEPAALLLNSRLGEQAIVMGYDACNFGERRADLTDRFNGPCGLAGAGWL